MDGLEVKRSSEKKRLWPSARRKKTGPRRGKKNECPDNRGIRRQASSASLADPSVVGEASGVNTAASGSHSGADAPRDPFAVAPQFGNTDESSDSENSGDEPEKPQEHLEIHKVQDSMPVETSSATKEGEGSNTEPLVRVKWYWSNEDTDRLVNLYVIYPELWDNQNVHVYLNKTKARTEAYRAIMERMSCPMLESVKDVQRKLAQLRNKYRTERTRASKFENKGKPFESTWPWYSIFQKMDPKVDQRQSPMEDYSDGEESNVPDDVDLVVIKEECDSENEGEPNPLEISPTKTGMDVEVAGEENPLEHASAPYSTEVVINDEFQMFANNIAAQLRKMPLDSALKMQLGIQKLIAIERTELYRKSLEEQNQLNTPKD